MSDNLPLLPEKQGAVCADVRVVLREVFREVDCLPPLTEDALAGAGDVLDHRPQLSDTNWIGKFTAERKELRQQEGELQTEYAKRLARDPLPNTYKLQAPGAPRELPAWRVGRGIIQREHLKPSIDQDAGRDGSLWVRNILTKSSGDLGVVKLKEPRIPLPTVLPPADDLTIQSVSIGELLPHPTTPSSVYSVHAPLPEYIICIPPQLNFVNFVVGQLYTQSLRLVNVSKFEARISIRPPTRRELDVELCSRLVVTSGSAAEVRVHFRPKDVRTLEDELLIRVSNGKTLKVPIACYMEPPVLDVLVPIMGSSLLAPHSVVTSSDVLDLGARLLGDVHRVPLLLRCTATHAAFFLLSEDSWLEFSIDVAVDRRGVAGVAAGCFWVSPARWAGGARGRALCCAPAAGLHTAALRILCSTAIIRPLHVVADALFFKAEHVTLEAQAKDYDICSDDDPACQYYVHLGTAFPHRALSSTVQIVNHSPVTYKYYWSVRPWGLCSCRDDPHTSLGADDDESELCPGAQEVSLNSNEESGAWWCARAVRVEPARGALTPRSRSPLHVRLPDAGGRLGVQRAALMLILTDVPKESLSQDNDVMIVTTKVIEEEAIPGVSPKWSREVCEVVCAQLEVWWEVVPVRFTLNPLLLSLPHSRRVKSVAVNIAATQLYGAAGVRASWALSPAPPAPALAPGQAAPTALVLPLPELPNNYPEIKAIRLVADNDEWTALCHIEHRCDTRHPALRPASVWLGLVPPGAAVRAELTVTNDTHQHICWWGTGHRWWREGAEAPACAGAPPCPECARRTCTCAMLQPTRGALCHATDATLHYHVNAPDTDGCVATLVQVQRTAADVARVPGGSGVEARATLLAYRVLAPRLVLRVLPCYGDKRGQCESCALDESSETVGRGAAVLRPRAALTARQRSCCRLRITNITPLGTTVRWEPAIEGEDTLKVTFLPNEFEVDGRSEAEIMVVLEARKVCGRRIFLRRASVRHAYKPLYLTIDTAISGIEVYVEMPLGGADRTDSFVIMKLIQKEEFAKEDNPINKQLNPEDIFEAEDQKRESLNENTCHCRYKMVYIPPAKPTQPPPENPDEYHSVEIISEPPPLTRVCPCSTQTKPVLPEQSEPYCLQFRQVPIRTVRSRILVLRNVSLLGARWSAGVRRWPRRRVRTVDREQWASDVREPGVLVQCAPASGQLAARARVEILVSVFADCWGLYHDQLLLQIENLEPVVIDIWVEAVGDPLQFALRATEHSGQPPPIMWLSSSDPERAVLGTNSSRADLLVYSYVVREHEYPQDELPFRLYVRLFDVLPRTCLCVTAFDSDSFEGEAAASSSSVYEEMDTGVELFLTSDFGVQDGSLYDVEPLELVLAHGESAAWKVRLLSQHQLPPNAALLLRSMPMKEDGCGWHRSAPRPQAVRLRHARRAARLQAASSRVRVAACALDLPCDDLMRIRKRLFIQNVGSGPLTATAEAREPWRVTPAFDICGAHCRARSEPHREDGGMEIHLPASSSYEMCVEVSVNTYETWPEAGPYPPRVNTKSALTFYDSDRILLLTIPLLLEIDFPILITEPASLDFIVSDGFTKKTNFSVKHSSPTATLELMTEWKGSENFRLWPLTFTLKPRTSERIYIQYTARWLFGGLAEGVAVVRARGGAGAWCAARVPVHACPLRSASAAASRDYADRTDDARLLPPDAPPRA